MQSKALVLLSGGMDSLAILAMAYDQFQGDVSTIHFNYGQKTFSKERECFENINQHYGISQDRQMLIHLPHLGQLGGSSLTDQKMQVNTEGIDETIIPTSYVPFRNTHFLTTAVSVAEVHGIEQIHIGAVLDDETGYPDCRPQYYRAFNELIRRGSKVQNISVVAPIIRMIKKEIIQTCLDLKAPLELTWSCYQNQDRPCMQCDSCLLRIKGFQELKIEDPALTHLK